MITTLYSYWDYWQLYHKVTFDGINKLIIVNPNETELEVKRDIYSDWKEWVQLDDNAKYLPAIRSIGGDPTDLINGKYAGDIYFLMNGWQIVIPHYVLLTGVVYHDDSISPFVILSGGGVRSTESNLVQSVRSTTNIVTGDLSSVPSAVRSNLTPELDHLSSLQNAPTASQNAVQVRTELTLELDKINSQVDGLTSGQLTMLVEMFRLMGLDPTRPLVVTTSTVDAGPEIHQDIGGDNTETTITRT